MIQIQEVSTTIYCDVSLFFFKIEDISKSMRMYMSETTVRDIVMDLLGPLIAKSKEESEYARNTQKRMDQIGKDFLD